MKYEKQVDIGALRAIDWMRYEAFEITERFKFRWNNYNTLNTAAIAISNSLNRRLK